MSTCENFFDVSFHWILVILQGRTCHSGNAVNAARLFVENAMPFFKRMRDIFKEFEALLKWFEAFVTISILFEDISRDIEALFI
jgi:hypothetical protein